MAMEIGRLDIINGYGNGWLDISVMVRWNVGQDTGSGVSKMETTAGV